MKTRIFFYFICLVSLACGNSLLKSQHNFPVINPSGHEVVTRFNIPPGYTRIKSDSGTFAYYLQHFPLKPDGARVYYFNGVEKSNKVYEAVLDIDVGEKDLQQCADAVIRLRAEYLYQQKLYDLIHFNFTSGFNAEYKRWAHGDRIKVQGNKVSWYGFGGQDYSVPTFKKYLDEVFTYAGTLSLSREMKPIPLAEMQIGDVFIKGGSPGHAVIIVDVAEDADGKKIFMIAQSYMPAQSIHILKNPNDPGLSPWYDLSKSSKLYSPEWTFEKTQLMRFDQ